MKTVAVEEFHNRVDEYLAETAHGDVVVTQNGKPWVLLTAVPSNGLPLSDAGQDAISASFAKSPAFWKMIQERRESSDYVPWDEAKKLIQLEE
jgi:prevent-host-death family protein